MIARELLEELKSVRRDFDWTYCGADRRIRGKLKTQPQSGLFDPIGAVCYLKTGLIFSDNEWLQAAEQIDLSLIDAGDLTAAANNVSGNQNYTRNLRREMIGGVLLPPENGSRPERVTELIPGLLRRKAHGSAKS
jgi:hypothetical protein